MNFEIGDVVELNSGGPPMTVSGLGSEYGEPNDVLCVWFEGKNRQQSFFDYRTLKKLKIPTQ